MATTYPGKINSPQTTLSAGINNAVTTIPVTDASVFPAAPNIATIGVDDLAETILYTGISGNTLTGCTRGFQGTAAAWGINSKISRNFTAYDYDALRQNADTHTADKLNHVPYAVDSGAANAYVVTLSPAPTAYVDGMAVCVKITNASTGASTINVNGLGVKTILDSLGNAITSGGLKANTPYTLRYNGTIFIVQGKGGGGNATAAHLFLNDTATVDGGPITGSMPNRAGDTAALASSVSGTTLKLLASDGYRDGVNDNVIITDANFIAANILKDISVLGVVGTSPQIAFGTVSGNNAQTLTVSGLAFTPSKVVFFEGIVTPSTTNDCWFARWDGNFNSAYSTTQTLTIDGGSFTVTEASSRTFSSAYTFKWIAIK